MLNKNAIFSHDKKYRYVLVRDWSNSGIKKSVMFIGLNPSIADENIDDPTIRRCINFAKSWEFNNLYMTNLFAYRATNPVDMLSAKHPIGDENNKFIIDYAKKSDLVIACWGNHGLHMNRGMQVKNMLQNLYTLKVTKKMQPAHPLYLSQHLTPLPF